jgi:hypothetical protein
VVAWSLGALTGTSNREAFSSQLPEVFPDVARPSYWLVRSADLYRKSSLHILEVKDE